MNPTAMNLTGRIFTFLEVLAYIDDSDPEEWLCRCRCGTTMAVKAAHLLNRDDPDYTTSCGCYLPPELAAIKSDAELKKRYKDEYLAFRMARQRGHLPARWAKSFRLFIEDVGTKPPGKQLMRRDTKKLHSPTNTFWGTFVDRVRKDNIFLTYKGQRIRSTDYRRITGVDKDFMRDRLLDGKSGEEIEAEWKRRRQLERYRRESAARDSS